jgi:SSS family solute:Na+ symporter
MFPQLFQRFYAAKSERSIVRMMVFYPIVTTVLFFFPVALGVLGRLLLPGLSGKETDSVLPLLMDRYGGDLLSGLACAGLLAAIMSTMDSQLLTLGSIVERDLLLRRPRERGAPDGAASPRAPRLVATRASIAVLALLGYVLALRPPATILAIATETFAGLAVLFPTVIAALYWPRATAAGSIASIAVGEAFVVLYHFKVLPAFGLLPAIPAVTASALVLLAAGLGRPRRVDTRSPEWRDAVRLGLSRRASAAWAAVFALFFVLSVDWWWFGDDPRLLWGLPIWLFYFVILGLALTVAYVLFSSRLLPRGPARRPR